MMQLLARKVREHKKNVGDYLKPNGISSPKLCYAHERDNFFNRTMLISLVIR